MNGSTSLGALFTRAGVVPEPQPRSGRQEMLENLVARHIERAR
jgi:hypothetical protein